MKRLLDSDASVSRQREILGGFTTAFGSTSGMYFEIS